MTGVCVPYKLRCMHIAVGSTWAHRIGPGDRIRDTGPFFWTPKCGTVEGQQQQQQQQQQLLLLRLHVAVATVAVGLLLENSDS